MRELDVRPGEPTRNTATPNAPVDYPVERVDGPVTGAAGIVRHRVDVDDVVESDDPIADVVTPHGERKATIETDEQGYVLGRRHGVATYENDVLVSMAARDDGKLIHERS